MGRTKFVRRARGKTKNQGWGAVVFGGVVDDDPVVEVAAVEPGDWSVTGTTERGVVLRIRGSISAARSAVGTAALSTLFLAIYLTDADAAVPAAAAGPDTATFYLEDVLWTASHIFGATGANVESTSWDVDFDVKSMRKITSDQDIRLAMITTSGISVDVHGLLRALIRRSG